MANSTPLRVGGVPEHFNLPFRLLEEEGCAIPFTWQDYPGGTGAILKALESRELDMATILTEGAVAHRAKGGQSVFPAFWVETPLVWGVFTGAKSQYQNLNQVQGKPFAISRPGSGSQLMAYLLARQENWAPKNVSFVEVGNLEGAVTALTDGKAAGFMWERFMTQPLVANGTFRRLGQIPTPWPAFIFAVHPDVWKEREQDVRHLMEAALGRAQALAMDTKAGDTISLRYGLEPTQSAEWLRLTRWAYPYSAETDLALMEVETILEAVGAI